MSAVGNSVELHHIRIDYSVSYFIVVLCPTASVVGVGILTYEYTFGDARGPSKVPTRGIIFARYASQLKFESP